MTTTRFPLSPALRSLRVQRHPYEVLAPGPGPSYALPGQPPWGQNWTPIGGQCCKPFDSPATDSLLLPVNRITEHLPLNH
jgi:hypothetical protein